MSVLRVGMLTSWNTRCGIAEYSRYLVNAMRRRGDVELTVFGSRNEGDRAVRAYEDYAQPVFDVQIWSERSRFDFDVDDILSHDLDVLHVQYSNLFYSRRRLVELLSRFTGVIALTFHDKVVPRRTFPHQMIDLLYAHREDVGIGPRRLIPQGIDVHPPVIKTFGLGHKARDEVVAEICERNGWRFERSFGEEKWLESEELYRWVRDCDAIVLWYPEDPTSGGSAAVTLAIATRRPVFVNDVEWFSDLPERTATVHRVGNEKELESGLSERLVDPYAEERSWDRVAARHIEDYRDALSGRASGSTRRGRRPTGRARLFALLDSKPILKAIARIVPLGWLRPTAHRVRQSMHSLRRPADR
jgi:hypothetical protein